MRSSTLIEVTMFLHYHASKNLFEIINKIQNFGEDNELLI
jgi:hypothetical protein